MWSWRFGDKLNNIRERRARLASLREAWLEFEASLMCACILGDVGGTQLERISKMACQLRDQRILLDELLSRPRMLTDGSCAVFAATPRSIPDAQRAASFIEAATRASPKERRNRALLILKEWNAVDELFTYRLGELESRERWLSALCSAWDVLTSWIPRLT